MSTHQRPISYATCNAMEKRILSRRPLNKYAVLSLKKPTLRRFLRSNGQRYKARDRKERLVQLTIYLSNKKPTTMNHPQVSSNRVKISSHKLSKRTLGCKNEPCSCAFNYIDVMNNVTENKTPLNLSKSIWNKIFLLSQEPAELLAQHVIGGDSFPKYNCKYQLAIQLRDKLASEEVKLKEAALEREKQEAEKDNNHTYCPKCHQNKPALVHPCNHLICKTCYVDPLQQVSECPICLKDVTEVTEAYEQTLEAF